MERPRNRPRRRTVRPARPVRLPAEPLRRRRGAPQVNAAATVLADLGVTDVAVIGLAKRDWRRSGCRASPTR